MARLEHYPGKAKCWYPLDALFGVLDPQVGGGGGGGSTGAPLRFRVGERVDCFMGRGVWKRGTVEDLWVRGNPYGIRVDGGGTITAPADRDHVVRAAAGRPEPSPPAPLRFGVGQRVDCFMGDGIWKRGTVRELWPREGSPYGIDTDDGGKITAPSDEDRTIRAAQD